MPEEQVKNKVMGNPNWLKGKSGNPKGRPLKGYSITDTIRGMLAANPEVKKALGQTIVDKALEGDVPAMKMLWNYMDGLPPQPLQAPSVNILNQMKVEFILDDPSQTPSQTIRDS